MKEAPGERKPFYGRLLLASLIAARAWFWMRPSSRPLCRTGAVTGSMIWIYARRRRAKSGIFYMKAHIGVVAESGLAPTVTTIPSDVGGVTEMDWLPHSQDQTACANARYEGAEKRAPKRSRATAMFEGELNEAVRHTAHRRRSLAPSVEHSFRVVKHQFDWQTARFEGLFKSTAQMLTLFTPSNLKMAPRTLCSLRQGRWALRRRAKVIWHSVAMIHSQSNFYCNKSGDFTPSSGRPFQLN
jgi:IS5 family transposase